MTDKPGLEPPIVFRFIKAVSHVLAEFMGTTGYTIHALAAPDTGMPKAGDPSKRYNRETIRNLQDWDGTGNSSNFQTALDLDGFMRMNFHENRHQSEFLYEEAWVKALNAVGIKAEKVGDFPVSDPETPQA